MQEMAKASQYPADHTLRFQQPIPSALTFAPPRNLASFVFSAPAVDVLDFSGPRGNKYNQLCRSAMAEAVMRCVFLYVDVALHDLAWHCPHEVTDAHVGWRVLEECAKTWTLVLCAMWHKCCTGQPSSVKDMLVFQNS